MKYVSMLLFLIPTLVLGQDIRVFTKYYKINNVRKYYEKQCKKQKTKLVLDNINDTLKINIDGYDPLIMSLAFDSSSKYCNFQEIHFICEQCIEKHIRDFLNDKTFKWRKISDDNYLSDYFNQIELVIHHVETPSPYIIMTFHVINQPRKEYRKYYNSLNGG